MKEILSTYTSYNLWANTKFLDVLKNIEPLLLDKEIKSSFPSLRKTMQHIWSAEEVWHRRFLGESLASLPEPENNFSAFAKRLSARSQSFVDLLKNKDENFLVQTCSYKDFRGNSHTNFHWQMIMHCMNHSTYHRGQIVTMLREVGVTNPPTGAAGIPSTDLMAYFREEK